MIAYYEMFQVDNGRWLFGEQKGIIHTSQLLVFPLIGPSRSQAIKCINPPISALVLTNITQYA